jgi:hypothetical protein
VDVSLELFLEGRQVAESLVGRHHWVRPLRDRGEITRQGPVAALAALEHQVMHESPRFGIEHRTFILFVVVRRRVIDAEQSLERQEFVLTQERDVRRTRLAEPDFLFMNVGIAVELRQAFVQP